MNEYKPQKTLALVVMIAFVLTAALHAFKGFVGLAAMINPDSFFTLDEVESISPWILVEGLLALIQLPLFLFTVVTFLIWLNRAHKNLLALEPSHLNFSSGWVVGWWFIPFANLVKPYQAVREVWCESDPELISGPHFLTASLHAAPAYMVAWWAFWLVGNISANISSRITLEEMPGSPLPGFLLCASSVFLAAAAGIAFYLVKDIAARQDQRSSVVAGLRPSGPPPPPRFAAEGV